MSRTARIAIGVVSLLLLVAGIVLAALGAQIAGMVVFSVLGIDLMAWAFYEVGASEDRERKAGRS